MSVRDTQGDGQWTEVSYLHLFYKPNSQQQRRKRLLKVRPATLNMMNTEWEAGRLSTRHIPVSHSAVTMTDYTEQQNPGRPHGLRDQVPSLRSSNHGCLCEGRRSDFFKCTESLRGQLLVGVTDTAEMGPSERTRCPQRHQSRVQWTRLSGRPLLTLVPG